MRSFDDVKYMDRSGWKGIGSDAPVPVQAIKIYHEGIIYQIIPSAEGGIHVGMQDGPVNTKMALVPYASNAVVICRL